MFIASAQKCLGKNFWHRSVLAISYRVYNSRTSVVEESIRVKFNDGLKTDRSLSDLEREFTDMEITPSAPDVTDEGQQADKTRPSDEAIQTNEASTSGHKDWKFMVHYPQDQILGDKSDRVRTKSTFRDQATYVFVSEIEPKNIEESLANDDWIMAIEEELN